MKYLLLTFFYCASTFSQPDISTFTSFPEIDNLRISPKGTYLAFTQLDGNREYIVVVGASDLSPVSRTSFGNATEVAYFDWVSDDRILLSPSRDSFGLDDKVSTGEIFGLNADGKDFKVLFGFAAGNGSGVGVQAIYGAGRIIDFLPEEPEYVIIQSQMYDSNRQNNSVWKMNVNTGSLRERDTAPIRNGIFTTDHNHIPRYVSGVNFDNERELYYLDSDDNWQLLEKENEVDNWKTPILPYGTDGKMLVTQLNENGMLGLSSWDPASGETEDIFHHDEVDYSTAYYDNNKTLWAVGYHNHYPEYFYPDPNHPLVGIHQQLRQAMPAHDVQIIDETDDLSKVIVYISGPQNPGEYIVLDVTEAKFLMRLRKYPNFPLDSLSTMDPIEITARDGVTIRGYLTLPKSEIVKDLPMVILPHGGPHSIYDTWTYNYEVQLLASRGYAVLQVNFRGSGGRGEDFGESGFGEWGGKMQEDIADSVLWAIADGVADGNRICIFGSSYGGYAALTGTYTNPDMFACAIGLSGVYDLNLMFEEGDISDDPRGLIYLSEVLGDNSELLAQRSPVENAHKMSANIMLIHGKLDVRAPFEHATRMRDALEDEGKEVTWLVETRETHGIFFEENRLNVYQQILSFLDENIGH